MKKLNRWIVCGVLFIMLGEAVALVSMLYLASPWRSMVATPTVAEKVLSSAVALISDGGSGSGVEGIFNGHRVIITADHVADTDNLQVVDMVEGVTISRPFKKVVGLPDFDLAIGYAEEPSPVRVLVPLDPVNIEKAGEDVYYAGYGAACRTWLEKSIVARPRWKCCDTRSQRGSCFDGFLVTGRGYYGNSGSGVWVVRNGEPRLAGILCRWATDNARCNGNGPLACSGAAGLRKLLDTWHNDCPKAP